MTILQFFMATLVGLSLGMLGGCTTTTASGAVGANRPQLMLISEKLDQMSAQSYTKLKSDAVGKGALNQDPAMLRRVRAVAERIEPRTGVFRRDAPGWKWEVNVISSNELNAFCMPGGKIMFYSGLINKLHLSDDEISIVMGHEIAHALREHSREQVSQAIRRSDGDRHRHSLAWPGRGVVRYSRRRVREVHRNQVQPHRRE